MRGARPAVGRELLKALIPLSLAILLILSVTSTVEELYFVVAWIAVGAAAGTMFGEADGRRITRGLTADGQAMREGEARSLGVVLLALLPMLGLFLLVMYGRSGPMTSAFSWAVVGAALFVLVALGVWEASRVRILHGFQAASGRRVRVSHSGRVTVYRAE